MDNVGNVKYVVIKEHLVHSASGIVYTYMESDIHTWNFMMRFRRDVLNNDHNLYCVRSFI